MSDILENQAQELTDPSGSAPEDELRAQIRAELEAEYNSMIDKRVTEAQKKWEKKAQREAALSLDRVNKLREVQSLENQAAQAVKEHELLVRGTRLEIVDIIAALELDPAFRSLVAYEDLLAIEDQAERSEKLRERIKTMKKEFDKLVKAEANRQVSNIRGMRAK